MNSRAGAAILIAVLAFAVSCSTQRKLEDIRRNSTSAMLSLADDKELPESMPAGLEPQRDTLKVQASDGSEVLIMRAVRDEDGEMVATDVITASYITARFRNVAERHGKVDLRFLVTVPAAMQDSKWQLRFNPELRILDDRVAMDPVIVTGRDYRRAQLRGYQMYERFLQSIISDTTRFIRYHELEVFLQRNLPEVYKMKTDSSYYSDERFASIYGVTEKEAVDHYTNQFVVNANRKKIARKDKMYSKYIKVPIVTEGLKLDTVITAGNGDFIYEYVQTINTMPKLKKAEIVISGSIFEEDKQIYSMPESDPLTFYISSLSSFVADAQKYLTQVIERSATANSTCWIEFETGRADVKPELGENRTEMGRIRNNLADLMQNKDFMLDSITVTASCSPEGSYESNKKLSERRSRSVSDYFERYMKQFRDSLRREEGLSINLDDSFVEERNESRDVRFIPHSIPENWDRFETLVQSDTELRDSEKKAIESILAISDPDQRERMLQKERSYKYLREHIYPRLRTVKFDFYLHRKGMLKDTVHTTVLDSVYLRGVEAIKDRDYETAVSLLRPYHDFNTAIAFCSLDYNRSALEILTGLEKTAPVNYMLALVYSRLGDDSKAVGHYLEACKQNPTYVHRGNLDPEISGLMNKYDLNFIEDNLTKQL